MKKELVNNFQVSYVTKGNIVTKTFSVFADANMAYRQIAKFDEGMPRQIVSYIAKTPVVLMNHNWSKNLAKQEELKAWKVDARVRLENAGMKKPQIDAVLLIPVSELRNLIASRNIDGLCEYKGIGEKTARKAAFALKAMCRAKATNSFASREFVRVILNNSLTDESYFLYDTIRKGVSPLEEYAMSIGGKDAIIHVVSFIVDPKDGDLEAAARAELLAEKWAEVCHEGLVLNGIKYVFLGHGTNSAKECKTIWVKESIFPQMKEYMMEGAQESWNTTAAKKIAYMAGLRSVTRKLCDIPFSPDEVIILPSVVDKMKVDVTKEFLDGHEENIDGYEFEVNRSDGYFMIDIPDNMVPELINRMVSRGMSEEEAEEKLKAFMNDTSVNSYRANNAALKGCGDKRVSIHKFLKEYGITTTTDGRSIDKICLFVDETVIKTNFGEKGAYASFEDWCKNVGDDIELGVCVKAHKKSKKDVSYQVLQALCEADGSTVRKMAQKTIDRVNGMHTLDGASRIMNRELGHIIRILPSIANERNVKERIEKKLADGIDTAFGGKLLKDCYYAFITPDPIYILQGWFGLEKTGCLEAGEFHVGNVKYGKLATWRSPVVHPNSVRVINNVPIKNEFVKYWKDTNEFVITMNSKDDISMAIDADWDGDHACVSEDEALIEAATQTLAKWNRLIVWETPKTQKSVITREDELDYAAELTHTNELGLTVYGLNALLNRIIVRKNPITKETYTEIIPVSHRGVNFKKFAANVLVDASKHGGATIDEPEESAQCADMLQPWAKVYRDMVNENETREKLDEYVKKYLKNSKHMVGTLNRLSALYGTYIDRTMNIYDVPTEKFDFHQLMFNSEETRRGLTGLIRKGEMNVESIDGQRMRPDQGLFDAIARRIETDRQIWKNDHSHLKDTDDVSFESDWRVMALEEIRNFAESMGATLEDAYDVITWQMFKYIDELYATMDGKLDFLRDNLWKAYWLIFGGMAEEAAERWEKKEEETDD